MAAPQCPESKMNKTSTYKDRTLAGWKRIVWRSRIRNFENLCQWVWPEKKSKLKLNALTLFHLGGGLFDPLYHESVCRIYRPRTRFTKIHDFVPFGICQDPVKLLLKFFSKKFEILDVKIFWGSSSIRKKWKNFEKFFFEKKPKIWNPYGQRVSQKKFE